MAARRRCRFGSHPNVVVGAEVWYLRHYDAANLTAFTGDAVMLGPTLYVQFTPKMFMTAAWNTQVWGREIGNPVLAQSGGVSAPSRQTEIRLGILIFSTIGKDWQDVAHDHDEKAGPGRGLRDRDAARLARRRRNRRPRFSSTYSNGQFQPSEVSAPADKPIAFRVRNLDGKAMEFESKSLRVEKVVAANSEGIINVRALKPGRYEFYDDFNDKARGALTVQ